MLVLGKFSGVILHGGDLFTGKCSRRGVRILSQDYKFLPIAVLTSAQDNM